MKELIGSYEIDIFDDGSARVTSAGSRINFDCAEEALEWVGRRCMEHREATND